MLQKLILGMALVGALTTEANAIGWNCSNKWGGNYTFTAFGAGGSVHYEGPTNAIDVAAGIRKNLWGDWWNLEISRHFEFAVPGFSYSCNSWNGGSRYWCDGTGGNEGVELVNCYGRPF
jgi:hypothetical protein